MTDRPEGIRLLLFILSLFLYLGLGALVRLGRGRAGGER